MPNHALHHTLGAAIAVAVAILFGATDCARAEESARQEYL